MSVHSVQDGSDLYRHTGRGRHRAKVAAQPGLSRLRTRAAVAAVTTGTVAVSGVALTGCSQGLSEDLAPDESTVTSPLDLARAVGMQSPGTLSQSNSVPVTFGSVGTPPRAEAGLPATDIAAPALTGKVDAGLRTTTPDVTVDANEPVQIGFKLFDEDTGTPIANQLIKIQVKLPENWATFKHLTTNGDGFASYEARVLTTTQVTAVFDGTDAYQSAKSENVALMRVRPQPVALPVQASRDNPRGTLTATPASTTATPAPATAPAGSSLGEKAVYLASQQAGKPYVYGAEGPYSFDCSGLVQYVFGNLGKSLPRTAQAQYNATTRISQFNKQPGDLIFMGSPGNIYHVGIYAGDGKMWAAPRTGEVVSLRNIWSTSYSVGRVY